MLGALAAFAVCAGYVGVGRWVFARWLGGLDPALRFGLSGMLGLAELGFGTFFLGLAPGGLSWGLWPVLGVAATGLWPVWKALRAGELKLTVPAGAHVTFVAALALAFLFALVGVLGPSDMQDWDSLAYHLAVPKLWLEAGQIELVPYIHHSNFPFLIDNLYIWGLKLGGEAGAKAFSLAYGVLGAIALFGFVRARYGERAGWWAALGFAAIPAALWEAGTAYVDLAHGLWSAFAVLFAAEFLEKPENRDRLALAAICAGCSAGSKYTGLQVAAVVAFGLLAGGLVLRRGTEGIRGAAVVGLAAAAIAGPWLVRNYVNLGNPVYPFFYSVFGGKNWDAEREAIYRNEQRTFGVGRTESGRDWTQFPHAVLGLAYQPGRYVNPGQERGMGFPTGALGFAAFAGGLLWVFSGRAGRFEGAALSMVLGGFAIWFALSQQSRYGMNMAIPLTALAGAACVRFRAGPILSAGIALQALYAMFVVYKTSVEPKLPVVLGRQTREAYLLDRVPFAEGAGAINLAASNGRVALYDEVFGFLLHVPYFWANPGHSTEIPYETLDDGQAYVEAMRRLGFSHVYVGFAFQPRAETERWLGAAGLLAGGARPFSQEERRALMDKLETRWKPLVAEACASGALRPVWASGKGVLLEL